MRSRGFVPVVLRRSLQTTLLHEWLDQPVELERVAGELRVGSAWLRRHIRHHTGLTVHHSQLQLRLNRAMHLLSGTTAAIKEIAAQTGFGEAHYFSRLFKKKTGGKPGNLTATISGRAAPRRR